MNLRAPTIQAYTEAFEAERQVQYPAVDAYERQAGYQLAAGRLLPAARSLACPLKVHAPNWQHGRVLYALARRYLAGVPEADHVAILDIGTAKGFSALCLQWALMDSGRPGQVVSVDVLDPKARTRRNTIVEVDGYKTLEEILRPWPESDRIAFLYTTGVTWLEQHPERVNIAFVDGKHSEDVVAQEGKLLAALQLPGDVVMFDDVQIEGVARAVQMLRAYYDIDVLDIGMKAGRQYGLGVRRG